MKKKIKNIFGKLYSPSPDKERGVGGEVFAFTLIELLVGISISVMLMISVSIFVTSGMKNILDEQKILKNSGDFNDFSSNFLNAFNYTGSGMYIKVISQTGVLFKRDQYFDKGGFSYVGEIMQDEFYCAIGSESTKTNHIILKTFIPFEEQGENMFLVGGYDKIFTATAGNYTSYALDHVVKDNTTGKTIIGKGVYGDKFENGAFGTGIYLNNPTGLVMSGSILFISDTLNNRVLYYKNGKIYKLLDEFDGLSEPTGLYYNAGKLYIANSGKGEILEYSSPIISTSQILTMSGFTISNVNKIDITFSGSNTPNLSNTGNFNITGNSTIPNYLTGTSDNLKYYFTDYSNLDGPQNNNYSCTSNSTKYILELDIPKKEVVTSCNTSTGIYQKYKGDLYNNISKIQVNSLNGFNNTGSYYVDLKLFNGATLKYQKYFPYFTQGDGDILTPGDNTLKIFTGGLSYPTGIWDNGGIKYNEFNKTGRAYDFKNTGYNKQADYILKTPLKSLIVDYNTPNKFLTIFLKYYKNYNCYNLNDNAQRSYVLKKKF